MVASKGWHILREEQECQVMRDPFSSVRTCDWVERAEEGEAKRQIGDIRRVPTLPHGRKSKLRVP